MATDNKTFLSNLMNQSWAFVNANGFTMSEAMKTAWLNAKLKKSMKQRIVRFNFRKVDGTIREAYGTLADNLLPPTDPSKKKTNNTLQVYFDTEKQEFRSFKKANLISVG